MSEATRFQMLVRPGNPDFLDLPWREPLDEWESERLVEVTRGIHRHVVRFVSYGERLYALKALPPRVARHEYRLLRALADASCRWSRPSASSRKDAGRGPARARGRADHAAPRLLAAVPQPLQRAGRRRPAQQPARRARRVARPHPPRGLLLGRLLALEHALPPRCRHALGLPRRCGDGRAASAAQPRPARARPADRRGERRRRAARPRGRARSACPRASIRSRRPRRCRAATRSLWSELTREDVFGPGRDLPHRRAPAPPQRARLRRRGGQARGRRRRADACASTPRSSSPGTTAAGCTRSPAWTCRRTRRAACSTTSPRSARRASAPAAPESVVAYRWLTECFEPSIAAVPAELRGKREPAELFHEILEHRWFLSEAARRDVGMPAAVDVLHRDGAAPPARREGGARARERGRPALAI